MSNTLSAQIREELANLPTVKYPDEVVERLKAISEVTRAQLAIGEIFPQTADEFAAEMGYQFH
jgi:hypothetical protein